jgi:thiol-disulfide isomerase/thioredoxin
MPTALLALLALSAPLDLSRPGVGDAAPPLELETLDGRAYPRARLEGGVTFVDFFTTWCHPCLNAHHDLGAIRAALGRDAPVHIVLVSVGESPAEVRKFLRQNPLPEGLEIALDRSEGTSRRWGAEAFPTTFLVDQAGIVRHINRGWGAGYQQRLLKWARAMLGQAGATPPPAPRPGAPARRPPSREVVRGVEVLRGG